MANIGISVMTTPADGTNIYLMGMANAGRDALVSNLAEEGFHVTAFADVVSFQCALAAALCDIAIVDIALEPGKSHGIVARLRSRERHMGIIVCSSITCLETRLQCLESGADAYLTLPVETREVAAHLRVLQRRLRTAGMKKTHVGAGDWMLIEGGWSLRDPSGNKLSLTTTERNFLRCLFKQAGQPVPRAELMASLGIDPQGADPHRLDVLVNRLRAKAMALNMSLPLRSVRSRGYVLAVSENAIHGGSDSGTQLMPNNGHTGGARDVSYPTWE